MTGYKKKIFGAALLLGGASVVLVGFGIKFIPTQKPERSLTKQEIAKNECATAVLTEYTKASLVLLSQNLAAPPLQSTIASTISLRRLQENFCLQFAQCLFPD